MFDSHKIPSPIGSACAGKISRESVRIAFASATLNWLEVFADNIRNDYLQDPSSEKNYVICGTEFWPEMLGNSID